MRIYRRKPLAVAALAAGLMVGCSETMPESPTPTPPAAQLPQASSKAEPVKTAPQTEGKTAPKVAFNPPYRNRTELFLPPSRKRAPAKSRTDSQVSLRGFVNVDQPRALLVVGGQLKAMAVGDRQGDVEVIVIDRPNVTLQRGRVRWTEQLYPQG